MRTRAMLAGVLLLIAACVDHEPTGPQLAFTPRSADLLSDALDPGFYWRDTDTLWIYDRKPEGGAGTHSGDATAISQLQSLNVRLTRYTLYIGPYVDDPNYKAAWISTVANMCAQGLIPVIVVHGVGGTSWSGWFPSFMYGAVSDNPCVRHWQLWNEPDANDGSCTDGNCVFGTGSPYSKGVEYAAMLIQTYPQIKSANPNALVVTAGVNFGNGPSFLQGVYAGGGRKYFDIVGVHPYGGATAQWDQAPNPSCTGVTGAGVRSYGQCYHNLFAANGDQGRILWSTEFGVSAQLIQASWGPQTGAFYDDTHRQWWIDALGIASTYRYYQKMIGYQLVAADGGVTPTDGGNPDDYGFGIIRPSGALRPAATWLQGSGYNTHALQYTTAAGDVTVYAPGKQPIGYPYTRNGSYVTFNVTVDKLSPTVVAWVPEGNPLTVSISGLTTIKRAGNNTWTCSATGGSGGYSYRWDRQDDGGSYYWVGSNSSYTSWIDQNNAPSFDLKCTVTSGGQSSYAEKHVNVLIPYY
jgi:hypothetical protein